jgi:hypothetical protein
MKVGKSRKLRRINGLSKSGGNRSIQLSYGRIFKDLQPISNSEIIEAMDAGTQGQTSPVASCFKITGTMRLHSVA